MTYGSEARHAPRNTRPTDLFGQRSGAELRGIAIRPVHADDTDRIATAFRALDAASIYQRFFFPKRELSDEELRRLTECDGVRDAVLVATVASGDHETIVGLCRYACNGAHGEIAVMVEQSYRSRGIAGELLRQLTEIARRNGLAQLEADVLPGNAPMLKVFRRAGLPIEETQAGGIVHVTLLLRDGSRKALIASNQIQHPDRTATFL